jgi:hypothetical protein
MCDEYSDWAWKARIAALAKKERKLPEAQTNPQHNEPQPEAAPAAAPAAAPRERDTVPA